MARKRELQVKMQVSLCQLEELVGQLDELVERLEDEPWEMVVTETKIWQLIYAAKAFCGPAGYEMTTLEA